MHFFFFVRLRFKLYKSNSLYLIMNLFTWIDKPPYLLSVYVISSRNWRALCVLWSDLFSVKPTYHFPGVVSVFHVKKIRFWLRYVLDTHSLWDLSFVPYLPRFPNKNYTASLDVFIPPQRKFETVCCIGDTVWWVYWCFPLLKVGRAEHCLQPVLKENHVLK